MPKEATPGAPAAARAPAAAGAAAEWTRDRVKATLEAALACASSGECEVGLETRRVSHTRFARNEVTTAGAAEDLTLTITSRHEGRSGTITTDDLSPAGVKAAMDQDAGNVGERTRVSQQHPLFQPGVV